MAGLSVDVEGDERLRQKLSGARGFMRNLKPPLTSIARTLTRRVDRQFRTSGAAGGTPWKPRSPATHKARARGWGYYRRRRGQSGILQSQGDLRKSFTSRGHRHHVERIGRQSMEWGSKHPLSWLHAQGPDARGPAPPLPQREIIAFRSSREKFNLFREPIAQHVLEDLADGR